MKMIKENRESVMVAIGPTVSENEFPVKQVKTVLWKEEGKFRILTLADHNNSPLYKMEKIFQENSQLLDKS